MLGPALEDEPQVEFAPEQPTARGFRTGIPNAPARFSTDVSTPPPARPTPMPNRPKGRWFIGTILTLVFSAFFYGVWTSLARYSAYGVVIGRVSDLSSPEDGVVRFMHVQEGQHVRQGQLLVSLENTELAHRKERLADELLIARASLDAEISKVRWLYDEHVDRSEKARADYYQALGTLLNDRAKLEEVRANLARKQILAESGAVTVEELQDAEFEELGLRQKVEESSIAVESLELRWKAQHGEDDGYDQLRPALARIETLEADLARAREELEELDLRSTVDGTVLDREVFPGERVRANEPILTLLEDRSMEIELYVPQGMESRLAPGDQVTLEAETGPVHTRVERVGKQFVPAPSNIERYYSRDEKLLRIFLAPDSATRPLRIGEMLMLPRFGAIREGGASP